MARVRADYVFGTLDVAVDADDTMLSSPALARLPVVADGDIAAITLKDRQTGTYEIVHVTDHTDAAVTATVVRGQEGSTAQAWGVGTAWGHDATAMDFLPAPELLKGGRFWGAWTPGEDTVVATYDFASGSVDAPLVAGGDSAVGAYDVRFGGAITPLPPANMWQGGTQFASLTLDMVDTNIETAHYVRFWMAAMENGFDSASFSVNGGTVESFANGTLPWTQYVFPITAADTLQWRWNRGGSGSSEQRILVARIEIIETVAIDFRVNDVVEHDGVLWAATVAGTTEEPGTGVEWVRVQLAPDDDAIAALVEDEASATRTSLAATFAARAVVYLPGIAGNYVSTPDHADLDITGDLEIVTQLALDDWSSPSIRLVAKGFAGVYALGANSGNNLYLMLTFGGVAQYKLSTVTLGGLGLVNGAPYWLKVTREAATGAIRFYYAESDGFDEPTAWTQIGADVSGTTGAFDADTSTLGVGASGTGAEPAEGLLYRAIVRPGIDAVAVADYRTDLPVSRYRDVTGKVWTLNGSASAWAIAP